MIKYGSIIDVKIDILPFLTGKKKADYKSSFVQNGDVIFADTAEDETVGKVSEIQGITDDSIVSGLHTFACRPTTKFAPCFLGHYLNSDSYHNQILKIMQGIKVLSISKSNLAKTDMAFPTSQEEQNKIAYVFNNLDNTITLHQCLSIRACYFLDNN